MLDNLILGFSTLASIQNILFCLFGCLLGTAVGILPGIGSVATLSLLIPYTYGFGPIPTLVMMAGIYYGAQYGGSTTSILLNSPGEPSSIMTCIDGYAMTQKGLGGNAIFVAGLSSFIAGCITIVFIALLGTTLADVGFLFGPAEYCNLMLLGLLSISFVTNKDSITGIALGCVGILLGFIGLDVNTGSSRFSFGIDRLADGIGIGVVAIGIFGITEVIKNLINPVKINNTTNQVNIEISKEEISRSIPAALRGTFIGSILGLIPGGGAAIASFISYSVEKRFSKFKHLLGKGAVEGIAGPEAANNAAAQVGFVPLLILGIPENAIMSIILGALVVLGIQPGPTVIQKQPELFWTLTCSMILGNLILLILNVPFAKFWIKILKIPNIVLYSILLVVSLLGVYAISHSVFDIWLAMFFGCVGYALYKLNLEPAPLMLGYIIGPIFEEQARRSLILSSGQFDIFYKSPISIGILVIISTLILLGIFKRQS